LSYRGIVVHGQACLCCFFAEGSGRDSEASSDSFHLGMLRILWNIIGHATSEITMMLPNKTLEPTADGVVSSAIAVHAASRRWLSFLR
jgi:hypothetical protein